jgi:hypothetical protein
MGRNNASGIVLATVLAVMSGVIVSGCGKGLGEADVPFAGPLLDTILEGIADGDYGKFSKDFSVEMKKKLAEEEFPPLVATLDDKLGEYERRSFTNAARQKNAAMDVTVVSYRARYSKEDGVKITLYVSRKDGRVSIEGLLIDSPALQR